MATTVGKTRCVTCGKDKVAYKCEGCSQSFCVNHLANHHRELGLQLDEIEDQRNLLQQTLTEQTTHPQKHSLIQNINQWEQETIHQIRQTAEEARLLLMKHTAKHMGEIEVKLTQLTEQLKETRQENDFNEIHLKQFKQKLQQLEEELNKPSNISIREDSSSFINKISVVISSAALSIPTISVHAKWKQNGVTVAGGNGKGNGLNQLSNPWGVYVANDQTIFVADYSNHRIVEWKNGATSGQIVAGGNEAGNRNDQLNGPVNVIVDKKSDCLIICDYGNRRVVQWPRRHGTSGKTIISNVACFDLVMDKDEYLYACDYDKHQVRRWKIGETNGTVVAGGNGSGNRLDQLSDSYYIFVDQEYSVYVSDDGNHRVMKWIKDAKVGIVVAGGQGAGSALTHLYSPLGVIVDQLGTVYVADQNNHRVMRWSKGARQGTLVVGGNGAGGQVNQLNFPRDLSFDRHNNLYVVDGVNHRVQKFNIELNSNS